MDYRSNIASLDLNVRKYIRDALEAELSITPENDEFYLTSSTILLEKQNELDQLKQELALKKEEFLIKMQVLEERRRHIEGKENKFTEEIAKFDIIFKENEEKLMNATKKFNYEKSLQRDKRKEIDFLNKSIKNLTSKRKRLEDKVGSYLKYRTFLEKAVKHSEMFHEIHELLARYDALISNLKDLQERSQTMISVAENQDIEFRRYRERQMDKKITTTNQIVELRNALEQYQNVFRQKEISCDYASNIAANRILQLTTIKTSIQNMYNLVRGYQVYGDPVNPNDLRSQLQAIQLFIADLSRILKTVSI